MKYTYAYKTSDGIRHEGSMNASSREEVFERLRKEGIKAIKVVAADGSKANGEVRGVRKRVVAVLVALAAICAGVIAFISGERTTHNPQPETLNPQLSSPRHQIYGDPAVVEGLERGDFGGILPREGDRMLAVFAQPGRFMCAKGANPRRLDALAPVRGGQGPARPASAAAIFDDYAKEALAPELDIAIVPDDPREIRELKQIVNGMRGEMRDYLANGNGTPRSFWRRLNERTAEEMRIHERTRRELEKETSHEVWEEKNAALRRLGLRTIPNPND